MTEKLIRFDNIGYLNSGKEESFEVSDTITEIIIRAANEQRNTIIYPQSAQINFRSNPEIMVGVAGQYSWAMIADPTNSYQRIIGVHAGSTQLVYDKDAASLATQRDRMTYTYSAERYFYSGSFINVIDQFLALGYTLHHVADATDFYKASFRVGHQINIEALVKY